MELHMLFTKSRFKMALECPTKLWYNQKENQDIYKNVLPENQFLQFLADNGHAIGEYAKFLYQDNPMEPDITVRDRDYDVSVDETNRRLSFDIRNGLNKTVIAEAAVRHHDFFIRVDIMIADHQNKTLELIEVKAKSVSAEDLAIRFKRGEKYDSKWLPYLYDVAFQTLVTEMAIQNIAGGLIKDYTIIPKLLLLNNDEVCDMTGLNEFIKIIRNPKDKRDVQIQVREGTQCKDLGNLNILLEVPMGDIVDELRTLRFHPQYEFIPEEHRASLIDFMNWASSVHMNKERVFLQPGKRCKQCQFKAAAGDPAKSGIHECFAHAIEVGQLDGNPADALNRKKLLVTEIWGGKTGPCSQVDEAIGGRHAFVEDISLIAILGKPFGFPPYTPFQRRVDQILMARGGNGDYRIHKDMLNIHLKSWKNPLHMIDFETTAPGIPYYEGMHPYELVAFQFSHHRMEKDGTIEHAGQFIDVNPTGNPNIRFVRALKQSLMPEGELVGTVFMYSKHERTTLKSIADQIVTSRESDKQELLDFIDALCSVKSPHKMIDLLDVVIETYISKQAGGSNSIKQILPAILHDAPRTAAYFSKPGMYGAGLEMNSLNFAHPDGHIWLTEASNWDPYKTLPPVMDILSEELGDIDEQLFGFLGEDGGTIDQGGLAMAAYNYTRYTTLGDFERQKLREGLLRYCELDTLAMCMLVRGLKELLKLEVSKN